MHIDLGNKNQKNDVKMANNDKGVKRRRENEEQNSAKKRKVNNGEDGDPGKTKVRIGNLSFDLEGKDDEIKKHFESCGEIKNVEMITRKTGSFAGIAILEFTDAESAKNALNMNEQEFYGRNLKITYSLEGGKKEISQKPDGCTTIFIGNLNFQVTEDQVKEFFADCGDIKECRWPKGDFTGIGWVEFYDTNATDLAIQKGGQSLMGREIRVDYASSRRKNYD